MQSQTAAARPSVTDAARGEPGPKSNQTAADGETEKAAVRRKGWIELPGKGRILWISIH
uniref:Uncharacterized protein n=1 Tax=Faecalibaculum rodentium TaxID=1702221 RepID=A0A140DTX7_9FIRM|nr:hypothetical protein AALO17_09700 [Faecalibaculum rodentium]